MQHFFKVTNKKEKHRKFQYQTGLNILKEKFSKGKNVRNGFHFSNKENICGFLSFGIYIRQVTLPMHDTDFKMVEEDSGKKRWRANKIILGHRMDLRKVKTWKYMTTNQYEIIKWIDQAINFAIQHNLVKIMRYLIVNYYNDKILTDVLKYQIDLPKFSKKNFRTVFKSASKDTITQCLNIVKSDYQNVKHATFMIAYFESQLADMEKASTTTNASVSANINSVTVSKPEVTKL